MMADARKFSDAYNSATSWAEFPGLDQLYGEMERDNPEDADYQNIYFKCIEAACKSEQVTLLGVELTAAGRRNPTSGQVSFITSFYCLNVPEVRFGFGRVLKPQKPVDTPYERAMTYMTEHYRPPNGVGPEPIVLHPELRDPELMYIVSKATASRRVPKSFEDYSHEIIRTYKWRGVFVSDAVSKISDQVDRFRAKFLAEIVTDFEQVRSNNLLGDSRPSAIIDAATLLVVPFIRNPDDQLLAASEGTGATGLISFIWLLNQNSSRRENWESYIAARVLELHRILTMKESAEKSRLLARKNSVVEMAAHEITNQVRTLQLDALRGIFFKGFEPSIDNFLYKLVRDKPDPEDENAETLLALIQAFEETQSTVEYNIQAFELAAGQSFLREKFQNKTICLIKDIVLSSIERVNGRSDRVDYPKLICNAIRQVSSGPQEMSDHDRIQAGLPVGYLDSNFLSRAMDESLFNARKHGLKDADGFVELAVEISDYYTGADSGRNSEEGWFIVICNRVCWNTTLNKSSKLPALGLLPGFEVSSSNNGSEYRVTFRLSKLFGRDEKTGKVFEVEPVWVFDKPKEGS